VVVELFVVVVLFAVVVSSLPEHDARESKSSIDKINATILYFIISSIKK